MSFFSGAARLFGGGEDSFKNIAVDEAAALIKSSKKCIVLDVRETVELQAYGKIKGVTHVSLRELAARADKISSDKGTEIIVVCQSGSRSRSAAKFLVDKGYTNVMNMQGGMLTWQRHGFPVARG